MTKVYIGLGTNLGDRAANLARAVELLGELLPLEERSRLFESEPVGYTEQPLFLNQVVAGETDLYPAALLDALKEIEGRMGRRPAFRNGPRLIDLDLLYYGDWVMAVAGLVIPHPRLCERSFVLAPLAEIAPQFQHPIAGRSAAEIWAEREPLLAKSWPYEPGRTGG